MLFHFQHFAALVADQFDDLSGGTVRHIHGQFLHRFAGLPVDLLADNMRLRDREFIALAAHVLDQDRDMENAASADLEAVSEFFDPESDIAFRLFEKPFADMAAADEFSFLPEQWRIVDAEHHGKSRFVDRDRRQPFGMLRIGHGIADVDPFDPDDRAEVAAFHCIHILPSDPLENGDLFHGRRNHCTVALDDRDGFGNIKGPAMHASDPDSTDIVIVIEC